MRLRPIGWLLSCSLAACTPQAPEDAPNILLIVADDLNDDLGCYGHEVCRTPNIDRLAAQGVRFDRAYCQFPMCGPSRTSFLSGLYPITTGVYYNDRRLGSYRASNPELADHPGIGGFLRAHGYFSARVSKVYHMKVPAGLEQGLPGGDDPEAWDVAVDLTAPETKSAGVLEMLAHISKEKGFAFSRMILPDEAAATQADYMAASRAIELLEQRAQDPAGKPFFLAVGLVRPHVPLIAPARLFALYPEERMRLPEVPPGDLDDVPPPARFTQNEECHGMSPLEQRQAIGAYYASVSFVDEQVGRLLDALDRLDLRRRTVVVLTSDHGYSLGEHGCWQKGSLFEEAMRVPLIVSAPGMQETAGRSSGQIVELVDLYPTLADLAGLGDQAPSILQGESLRPLLASPDDPAWPKRATYGWTLAAFISGQTSPGETVRTARWRYNRWADGAEGEELYDLDADPGEFHNLAGRPEHAEVLESLRGMLLPRG